MQSTRRRFLITILLLIASIQLFSQSSWSTLEGGKYSVGFKTVRMASKAGNPMLISIWYPAEKGNARMSLEDFIKIGEAVEVPAQAALDDDFETVQMLTNRVYRIPEISKDQYGKAIAAKTNAFRDAKPVKGNYPLTIGLSGPTTYFATAEFLASHGFIVAFVACRFPDDAPSPETPYHYQRYTDVVGELMEFMIQQPDVQKSNITTFGHGFTTQPAVYLAMRGDNQIKKVINLDGGFFGVRSKSTISIDYHPDKLSASLLHITTAETSAEDDAKEFAALKSPITVAKFKTSNIMHHDFTSWGRLISTGFDKKRNQDEVNTAFREAHEVMLKFLQDKSIGATLRSLEIQKFN